MKETRILNILSWFHAVIIFSALYLLIPSLLEQTQIHYPVHLVKGLILFLPVIISYYMLKKIHNLILYLMGAIVISGVLWAATKNWITLGCSILIFMIRCYTRVERGRIQKQMRDFPGEAGRFYAPEAWEIPTFLDKPGILHIGILLFGYFALIFSGQHAYLEGFFYLILLEFIIHFLYRYVDHMKTYVLQRQKIANLPVKTILRNGYVILLGLGMLFAVMILPSVLYGEEPLKGLYHTTEHVEMLELFEMENQEAGSDPMMEMIHELAGDPEPTPAWLEFLSNVILWFSTVLIVVLMIFAIVNGLRRVFGAFAEEEEDEIIDLKLIDEEARKLKKQRQKEEKEKRNSPEFRIRRKYKKRIRKTRNWSPLGSETPEELERKADLRGVEDTGLFHTMYEKARYSKEGCTDEEERNYPG